MDRGDDLRSRYQTQQRVATSAPMRVSNHPIKRKNQLSPTIDDEKLQGQHSENRNKKHQKSHRTLLEWFRSQPKHTKVAFAVVAVLAGVGVATALPQFSRERGPQSLGVASGELDIQDVRPVEELSFAPFYPSDYEDRGIVFAQRQRGETDYVSYTDVLDGAPFTVTQQRATKELAGGDLAQLENIGKSLPVPAERYFRVGETPAFISEANNDTQSLVFVKEEVLFFVTAESAIREFEWAMYINNLVQ